MREYQEYLQILELWEQGFPKRRIAIITGIPRATVRDCIIRFHSVEQFLSQPEKAKHAISPAAVVLERDISVHKSYAYVLGIYLGDGNITKNRRVYRLRVTLDTHYPNIIRTCVQAIETLLPTHKVGISPSKGCVNVSCYYKYWPVLLPQHGPGRKHQREVKLEDWQRTIVDAHPLEFFRGLYHSDGSRFSNVVNGKDYPRYQFTNTSNDITQLFCNACQQLSLHWTAKRRRDGTNDIYISKRKDVEYLDSVIGPKN